MDPTLTHYLGVVFFFSGVLVEFACTLAIVTAHLNNVTLWVERSVDDSIKKNCSFLQKKPIISMGKLELVPAKDLTQGEKKKKKFCQP